MAYIRFRNNGLENMDILGVSVHLPRLVIVLIESKFAVNYGSVYTPPLAT